MTKITTDFVGGETIAVTKQRLTDILAYWGASTAAYTTWGQARTALNALLTSTTAGTIGSTELAGSFLPKINFLNDPDEMIADALFGAGEQGVWLDPSDVANVDWRRNLFLYSESFDTASWNKDSCTIAANTVLAPDGTMTADRIVSAAATAQTGVGQQVLSQSGVRTASYYVQANGARYVQLLWSTNSSTDYANFDLQNPTAPTAGTYIAATITPAANSFYRITITSTLASAGGGVSALWMQDTATAARSGAYTGNGTSGIYVWGAQLELGTTATEYQRITDLNTEVIERFPNATMYQDTAGTVPVYAPGQPVGLRLDKSKGLVLGPELIANAADRDFSSNTGFWSFNGGVAIAGGTLNWSATPDAYAAYTTSNSFTTPGKYYEVTWTITSISSGGIRPQIGGNLGPTQATPGTYTTRICAGSAANRLGFFCAGTTTASIDNVSFKEVSGNHATQSTLGSRPMYGIEPKGGRRNLLTWSEDFRDTAAAGETRPWFYTNATIPTTNNTAPNGTATADKLDETAASDRHRTYQVLGNNNTAYTFTCYLKAAERTWAYLNFGDIIDRQTWFNLATGVVGTVGSGITATIVPAGNGWYRCSISKTTITPAPNFDVGIATADGVLSYTGVAGNGIYIWGAQLDLGSTATPYQRVTTDFDVTEAGVNTCHYCQYDGINGGMVTNSIDFTATDKMSVFAGVRKLSDTNPYLMVLELSAASSANNGAFALMAPYAGPNYGFDSKGTVLATAASASTFPAPINSLLTALGDISGDRATLRVNGVQAAQNTGDQGTGNFGNYKLNIGRRGNDQPTPSLPFKGRDYGLLVVGKLANATAIATTEIYLASKTSGVNL